MWQEAVGLGLALLSLGVTVVWFVVDEWVRFYDGSGYIPGEGNSGMWHVCNQGICFPIPPAWDQFVTAPLALSIFGIIFFALFLLSGGVSFCYKGRRWQHLLTLVGLAIALKGVFSAAAGAACISYLDDMYDYVALIWAYEVTEIKAGWCTILAIVAGVLDAIGGFVMYKVAQTMSPSETNTTETVFVNALAHESPYYAQPEQHPVMYTLPYQPSPGQATYPGQSKVFTAAPYDQEAGHQNLPFVWPAA